MSDEMRDRLGRLDPARDLPDVHEKHLTDLLEEIMNTHPGSVTDHPESTRGARGAPSRRRRMALAVTGAAACAALAIGLAVSVGSDDSASESLTLAGSGDDALASCLPVTAEFMADMPIAFAATATSVDADVVTLTVDEWFAGQPFDTVVVTQADDASVALIGGVRYVEGDSYLLTAAEGQITSCGYSGPDTPELRAIFAEAFGA